jgi:hypothetical protein
VIVAHLRFCPFFVCFKRVQKDCSTFDNSFAASETFEGFSSTKSIFAIADAIIWQVESQRCRELAGICFELVGGGASPYNFSEFCVKLRNAQSIKKLRAIPRPKQACAPREIFKDLLRKF